MAAGDLLVRFDIPASGAEVSRQRGEIARAEAQIANARAAQTRAKDLFERGIAARKEMEDADRDLAEAEAVLAEAQAALAAADSVAARAVVRAPFAGVVARRLHNPGDVVEAAATDPVLRLVDPRRIEVVANVSLGDVMRVVLGAPARLAAGATRCLEAALNELPYVAPYVAPDVAPDVASSPATRRANRVGQSFSSALTLRVVSRPLAVDAGTAAVPRCG